MSLITRPLPGLFGGVSQQIPALRHPTHCEESTNMLATTVDGLYTRPGTQHIATLDLTGPNGASVDGSNGDISAHTVTRVGGLLYDLAITNGNLMLYDTRTGAVQTVAFPNGKGYLTNPSPSTGFSAITVADYTFITNKTVTPAMTAAESGGVPTNVAYVDIHTAVPLADYSITIDGLTGAYTATSAPTNKLIADELVTALGTALGAGYTVSILSDTNTIKVLRIDGLPLVCSASDAWGNTAMKVLSNGVPQYADLPPRFEAGFTIRITGSADSAKDGYYVKWDGTKWVETLGPEILYEVDEATMPHQLYQIGDGTWIFEQIPDWEDRLVGDEDSNPLPSFIGNPIRDVFFLRNRLGFLAGDSAVLSRAGRYFDFFSKSATQVLDSDPIDLAASVDGVDYLAWAVPFNTNLLIWTNSKQQMLLTGGDILTPNTARLMPTTSFAYEEATRPSSLGNQAIFAEGSGSYSQLSRYKVSMDTVTNKAETLTEHVPRFLPAAPRQLACSTAWKGIMMVPSDTSATLYHMKYELNDADEVLTQKSWSPFILASSSTIRVLKAHWDQRKLYLLLHYTTPGDVAGGRLASEVMDFQADAVDTSLDYRMAVDRRVVITGGTYDAGTDETTYTVPFYEATGATFLRTAAGREPYPLTPLSYIQGPGSATVSFLGDQTASQVWAGRKFSARHEFTEVVLRDDNGIPIQSASTKLVAFIVRYVDSTRMRAVVTPYLRETYTYEFGGRIVGLPLHGIGLLSLDTGDFKIPVGAQASRTRVAIECDGPLPIKLPYAEWVGSVTMKAKR